MKANIYDVSTKAGVSIATVSRVLNGSANVSDKTREKVHAAMLELGYTPNAFARGLGLGSMNTIGIMCSDSSDTYLANAVYHLEHELRKNGYDSFLCCSGYELETKKQYLKLLLSKQVDALILVGSSFLDMTPENNQYIVDATQQVPVMLMNAALDKPNIYSVLCDDFHAVKHATSSLIQTGHRRILFLYKSHSYSGNEKLAGYRKAFKKHQLEVDERLIQRCPKKLSENIRFIAGLYDMGLEFDAVIASEDIMAVGAVKFAKSRSLRIPDELSIVGFNNSVLAECSEPAVTSIDNRVEALSVTTVNQLMQLFAGRDVPQKIMISADLVQRATTNFPPA
ncbi:MAG: LacI family DNA-binding transcriptional regulator [Lachnospiraceae bacterium]